MATKEQKLRKAWIYERNIRSNDYATIRIINIGGDRYDNKKPIFRIKHSSDGHTSTGLTKSNLNKFISALKKAQNFVDKLNK